MSFITKGGGVTALSGLTIDVDKNWAGMGISNLKELALAMVQGDLVVRGAAGVLVRLPPGVANTMLTSAGPGVLPFWGPGGLYLNRYFPATIALPDPVVTKNPVRNYIDTEPAPLATAYNDATGDQTVGLGIVKAQLPAITIPDTENLNFAPDYSEPITATTHTHIDLIKVLEGAVADDGGATTDETAAAQNVTANDMTLFPAAPADDDAYYFGSDYVFDELILNIGTAGNGVWSVEWEYYDVDTTWHALADLVDGTNAFEAAAGNHSVTFTKDANWTSVAVGGIDKFWIRCRIDVYTSIVTQPKGTQAWYKITI